MKIIYTGAFRFPNKDAASQRVLNNGKLLRDLGHDVIFFGWESAEKDLNDDDKFYQGFPYKSMDELDQQSLNIFDKIFKFINKGSKTLYKIKETKSVDLIIVYNSNYLFLRKIQKYCKKKNIKVVVDCTEWYESSHLPGGKYGLASLDNYYRMVRANVLIKNIIVISSYLNNFYENRKCLTLLLPPLVDLNDEKWNVSRCNLVSFDKEINIIYAGDPGNKDLLDGVIEAIGIVNKSPGKKINFNILGLSTDQLLKVLNFNILPKNVKCLGRVKMEQVPKIYSKSHFSILIRHNKRYAHAGFSTKFVESSISGIPVIANNTSDICNYLENKKSGFLLDNCTVTEIVHVLEIIKNMTIGEYNNMSNLTRENSRKFFSYKNYIKKTQNFLDKSYVL